MSMPITHARFDHLIHWVHDLDAARSAYDTLGLSTHEALTMPGFRNAAWGVDDERYVELAIVDDWDAVARSKYAESTEILRPAIEELHGPGLLTFAVDVPDARETATQLREAGHDVVEVAVRFEERNAGFVEVFVIDLPGWFPFFITYDPPRAQIARMRAEYRAAKGIDLVGRPDLVALSARSEDPVDDARRLGDLLGCGVDDTTVLLPGAEVRIEHGSPSGLYGFVVKGSLNVATPTQVAGCMVVDT